jgi:spermidine/putrescine transport system permease protein
MQIKNILNILPLVLWQTLFLFIPCVSLFYNYFYINKLVEITTWLISNNYFRILFNTFKMSFFVSIICLVIAYTIAYCISQQNKKIKKICLFIFFIPFITNFLLHMLSLMNLFYKTGLINAIYNSFPTLLSSNRLLYSKFLTYIGYIYCYLPYMFIPLYNSLLKFDISLYKASTDLGASFWQTIFRVLIPNTKNAIITSFFLVFVSSSGEFIINEILGGDKNMQAGSIISFTILSGNLIPYSIVMILFFILILIILFPLLYQFLMLVIYYMKKI